MSEDSWLEDIGEGAYYSDEENRKFDEEPYPDEEWDREFEEMERGGEDVD